MAKRDVDVVIGARTDDASFRETQQKTQGFLQRLRGGGQGGLAGSDGVLQRTARAQEMLSKVVAAAAILREGVAALNAGLEISRGLMAGLAGDAEAFDRSIGNAKEALSRSLVGSAGLTIGEMIFGDQRDADAIAEGGSATNANNARRLAGATQRQAELQRAREEIRKAQQSLLRDEQLAGVSADDAATFAVYEQLDARTRNLEAIRSQLRELEKYQDVEQEILQVNKAIEESIRLTQDRVKSLNDERSKAIDQQIESLELSNDAERRLFGAEGIEREIELIKLRTEARERELQVLIDAAKTEEQRARIRQIIGDTQARAAQEIADLRNRPGEVPFRAGGPALTEGLLLSGQNQAAQSGIALQTRTAKATEETVKEVRNVASAIVQLIQATAGQRYAPLLPSLR